MPFRHVCEGPDDMPAHVKVSLIIENNKIISNKTLFQACFLGASLSLPITEGRLSLGTWQGI